MTDASRLALAGCWLILAVNLGRGEEKPPRLDGAGDPLPELALARLGSLRFRDPHGFRSVTLSPDGKVFAVDRIQGFQLFDAVSGKSLRTIGEKGIDSSQVTFSPEGKFLAAVHRERGLPGKERMKPLQSIQLWERATGKAIRRIPVGELRVGKFVLSGDGKRLAVATGSDEEAPRLHVFDIAIGKKLAEMSPIHNVEVGLALSADGSQLVTWCGWIKRDKLDETKREAHYESLQLWDPATGKETKCLRILWGHFRKSVALSPDGKTLAASSPGAEPTLWDVATGKERSLANGRSRPRTGLVFSADGKTLAAATADGAIGRWDVASGERLGLHKAPFMQEPWLTFTPEGRLLAWDERSPVVLLHDVLAGKTLTPMTGHLTTVQALTFRGGGELVSFSGDGVLCRWDLDGGKGPVQQRLRHEEYVPRLGQSYYRNAEFAPDGKHMVVQGGGKTTIAEVLTGRQVWDTKESDGWTVTFSSDSTRVALAQEGYFGRKHVRLHAVLSGKEELALTIPRHQTLSLALSPDGRHVVTAPWIIYSEASSPGIRMWDLTTGKESWRLNRGNGPVAFSPDGDTLAIAGIDGSPALSLCDPATGVEHRRLKVADPLKVGKMVFAPDGRTLAVTAYSPGVAASNTKLMIWETATGSLRLELPAEAGLVYGLAYSPDGSRLATGGTDTTVLLWDLTGRSTEEGKPRPGPRELDELWAALAEADGRAAHRAMSRLISVPAETVALARRQIQPATGPTDAESIARLIDDLDHRRFTRREEAMRRLASLGGAVQPALTKALEGTPSAEKRKTMTDLLGKLRGRVLAPEDLRLLRAVEVLERLGTPEARRLLEELGDGNPAARLSREAKTALVRMARLSKTAP